MSQPGHADDRDRVRGAIRNLTPEERERLVAALAEAIVASLREQRRRDQVRRLSS